MKLDGLKARVDAAVDKAIAEQRIVGTVLIVAINGETVYRRAAGLMDREAGVPMREDAIFRLASLTKPIVASTALAMIDAGLFGLDDVVTDHLPFFAPAYEGNPVAVTVRHLLSHASGLSNDDKVLAAVGASPGMVGPIITLEENVRRLGRAPLAFAPGTGWAYGPSLEVLGCLIAKTNKSTLGEAVQRHVTGPLGMLHTSFGVADLGRLAVPYADGKAGPPVPMGDPTFVVDPTGDGVAGPTFVPSRIFNPLAFQSASSGMAGSAPDFMKLLAMFAAGGSGIIKPETLAEAGRNQIGDAPRRAHDAGKRFGLFSAILDDPAAARSPASRGTLDWGGIYGHNWFYDPVLKLGVASLSNTAMEGCNGPYRHEIRDAVYGASA